MTGFGTIFITGLEPKARNTSYFMYTHRLIMINCNSFHRKDANNKFQADVEAVAVLNASNLSSPRGVKASGSLSPFLPMLTACGRYCYKWRESPPLGNVLTLPVF